jgi:hypothetical protein
MDLEDPVPIHSTFSKNRHGRFRDSETFRHVFEGVLERRMAEGLVRSEMRTTLNRWYSLHCNRVFSIFRKRLPETRLTEIRVVACLEEEYHRLKVFTLRA